MWSSTQKLLRTESIPIDIMTVQELRIKLQEECVRQEKQTLDFYLHDSLAWLKMANEVHIKEQGNILQSLFSKRHKGTCQWMLKNPLFQNWKEDSNSDQIL